MLAFNVSYLPDDQKSDIFLRDFVSFFAIFLACRIKLATEKKFRITKLRKKVLHFCAARILQICARIITKLRRYYKFAQKVLQICAGITNLRTTAIKIVLKRFEIKKSLNTLTGCLDKCFVWFC